MPWGVEPVKTPQPMARILVKLRGAPEEARLRLPSFPVRAQFEPLFKSIKPAGAALKAAASGEWRIMTHDASDPEVNPWDLCHRLVADGLGAAGMPRASFAEPDLAQQWVTGAPAQRALAAARSWDEPAPPDAHLPAGDGRFWFRDADHSQLEQAGNEVGEPAGRVRVAHFDTGYDPRHCTRPKYLLASEPHNLQRNFADSEYPLDATDRSSGRYNNLGHGTGTLSLLAGAAVDGKSLGGAPYADVIPIRVADSVVLFWTSAIARALDYVHGLFADLATRAHVITMSMGGLASETWADAVNALYERGVFIVTAAGNNFGNLPTRNIVFPARFRRVVAACGVMADGKPYADLPMAIMAGNYGPESKMRTTLAAFTPNTPWARFGTENVVDCDGRGTSAATPQIAAAAALYIQRHKAAWESQYPKGWMRVEAVRHALFRSARNAGAAPDAKLGRGQLRAADALRIQPAEERELAMEPADSAAFPFLRVITGMGIAQEQSARQQMLELEALQLAQRSFELERLLPDPEHPAPLPASGRQRVLELLHDAPGASGELRAELAKHASPVVTARKRSDRIVTESARSEAEAARLEHAMDPPVATPSVRRLRVFAFDPLLGYSPDTLQLNETALKVRWEALKPGPVGEYLEVVDIDPASACCYAPVDLDHPAILAGSGLAPSEASPYFHQQMCYAVAMKTIAHFERALGRVALWAPRIVVREGSKRIEERYVRRLRIYPHALREANSYYSPRQKALLLGYFPASPAAPGEILPGGAVFCALSHDIIAHETTHALLDGLHRYFTEPANLDTLAFHEAFADIVALFQHFTIPEALLDQIRRTRGDLADRRNLMAQLACQFGRGIGCHGSLRDALGSVNPATGQWEAYVPRGDEYQKASEPHDRGAVLVAAVFDAFLDIYRRRCADLARLASAGTGVLPPGEIPDDLVNRLAREAAKTAEHILNICIRALDYCPPVGLKFGEYLRALISADCDLVEDDRWAYRAAFVQGFRRRGIYPVNVRSLSVESLRWESPESRVSMAKALEELKLTWDLHAARESAFQVSRANAARLYVFLKTDPDFGEAGARTLGFRLHGGRELDGAPGELRDFEVHSVRPVRRTGPDGQQRTDVVVEITQSWKPADGSGTFRGGCTLIIDGETKAVRYVIRKRVGHPDAMREQEDIRERLAAEQPAWNYRGEAEALREPFALLHGSEQA